MNSIFERESRQIEYKELLINYRSLCKTIVAFSNDIGGEILIGVRDKDRKIVGIITRRDIIAIIS